MSHPPGEVIHFLCQGCGELVPDVLGLTAQDGIDSGIIVKCPKCDQETIIDLFRPEERREMYKARERIHLLPTYAMEVLLKAQEHNHAILERARAKVQEWLNEAEPHSPLDHAKR